MFRGFRTISILSAVVLVCGLLASAGIAKPGGKKAIGEIVSFDEPTIVIDLKGESEDLEAEVAEDAQIKLEHRGNHDTGKGHGNPTTGSFEDLVEGAKVLRLKFDKDDGVITKIRVRAAPEECETDDGEGDEDAEGTEDEEGTEGSEDDEGTEDDEGAEDADGTDKETECPNPDEAEDEADECEGEDADADDSPKKKNKNKNKNKGTKKDKGSDDEPEC